MNDKLNGLSILKQARKHDGVFLLEELNDKLREIAVAIRKSPTKSGSLNINISLTPSSTDGEMVIAQAEIKNVKIPAVDTHPIHAWITPKGDICRNDPQQVQMFDETTEHINKETGEITKVPTGKKITPIK